MTPEQAKELKIGDMVFETRFHWLGDYAIYDVCGDGSLGACRSDTPTAENRAHDEKKFECWRGIEGDQKFFPVLAEPSGGGKYWQRWVTGSRPAETLPAVNSRAARFAKIEAEIDAGRAEIAAILERENNLIREIEGLFREAKV